MQGDISNNIKYLEYPSIDISLLDNGILSEKQIINIISNHNQFVDKFSRNLDFYVGKNKDIRHKISLDAPDNLINISYGRKMVNTIKGYEFKPGLIKYSLDDTKENIDENYFNLLMDIFYQNNEEIKNSELGEDQSKYGLAFEMLYNKLNDEGKAIPGFIKLNPNTVIPIFDNSIEKKLYCCIRYYVIEKNKDGKDVYKVEIYYSNVILYYNYADGKIQKIDKEDINIYNDVPFVLYINNDEFLADYEPVEALIMLYDKLFSDNANELDRFAAAYLVMKNFILGGDDETARNKLQRLKELRVFEVDRDGDLKFLTKDIPVAFFQEIKKTIQEEIRKQSHIPDFSDDSFGTASGIAIKYKLIDLENLCSFKEAYFKEGLYRRIKLINKFLKLSDDINNPSNIKITFNRNIPQALQESVDAVQKLNGIISNETLLTLLPFITDISKELEKIKKEKEEKSKEFDIDKIEIPKKNNNNVQDDIEDEDIPIEDENVKED